MKKKKYDYNSKYKQKPIAHLIEEPKTKDNPRPHYTSQGGKKKQHLFVYLPTFINTI